VEEAKSTSQLIREVENSYRRHLSEGAKLLKGSPSSILSEVQCKPNGNFSKIMERVKGKNGLRIASYTDEEIVRGFLEQNKESIPIDHEIVCSKLETVDGSLTGMFSKIPSKTDGYVCGDVFEDSIGGIKLCNEAYRKGYQVHVVRDGDKARMLEETLRKIGIDYSYL